ncbi:hypothetical protein [Mycetocola saprophilus]|uniref:hypothetical protein n=1 Tax=Mycetocola saprophilus TaxID=76636 RepID=UPI003BF37DFF
MAASGFGHGWVRLAQVEAARVWHARTSRWIIGVAMLLAALAAAVPAIMSGVVAQDNPVPSNLSLDDPQVVHSLYLAGAGILALPALVWGVLIGDPQSTRRRSAHAQADARVQLVREPQMSAAVGASIRRGSLADSRVIRAKSAAARENVRNVRADLRDRSMRVSERVCAVADPRSVVIARIVVGAGAGVALGVSLIVAAFVASMVVLTLFGASLWLVGEHLPVIGMRMVLVTAVITVIGAALGTLIHGLQLRALRPLLLGMMALVVVGGDAAVRIAQLAGSVPETTIRYVPSVVVRAASGVLGTGFPAATPFAVSGTRALALLALVALLTIAAAVTRAAMISKRAGEG